MKRNGFPVGEFAALRTPFYYYDTRLLSQTLDTLKALLEEHPYFRVHYAVKANANPVILKMIAAAGLGADCVSGGEVQAALDAGFPHGSIVFAGVGKSDWEIELALKNDIAAFNVESEAELEVIADIAASCGKVANVALRVNPDVGAHTHQNITTGLAENKFGINMDILESVVRRVLSLPSLKYKGLHFHIGSQILDMSDFEALCERFNQLSARMEEAGLPIPEVNFGGGLGIDYVHPEEHPIADFKRYFEVFASCVQPCPGRPVHFELGRSIVAPCGTLISRALYVKEGSVKKFAILDAGMTDLIRPAFYNAYHKIENLSSDEPQQVYDVVGPICESSDVFAKGRALNAVHRGDFVAFRSAGAYGETMAMGYNCRQLPKAYFDYDLMPE